MATTIHAFSPEEMMAYLDGELTSERTLEASNHLDQCRECQNLVASLQHVSSGLAGWEVELCNSSPPAQTAKPFALAATPLWKRPWLVTSFAAFLLLAGLGINQRFHSAQNLASMTRELPKNPSAEEPASALEVEDPNRVMSDRGGSAYSKMSQTPGAHATLDNTISREAQSSQPLVVRTAQLALIIKDFDRIRIEVERVATAHRGYIGQLQLNMDSATGRSLMASLRVPSTELDAVIRELKQLGHVASESQNGDDVTRRAINLEARVSNLKITESRLQQLLVQRTGKLADVLQVEEAVDRVRGEIEAAEAEQKMLMNQISYAQVELTTTEEYKTPLPGNDASVLTRLRNSAVEGYRNAFNLVVSVVTFLLSIGPALLIVAGLCFFPALWIKRKWRQS